jgi:lysophospholipase L1-like esterase
LPVFPKYKNVNFEFKNLSRSSKYYDNGSIFIGSSIIERLDFEKYFAEQPYINRGVGDNTTVDMLHRFDEDVIALRPVRVVIYVGTNDIKYNIPIKQTKSNIKIMLKRAVGLGIEPVLLLPLPVNYNKNMSLNFSHPSDKIQSLNLDLAEESNNLNIKYIDLIENMRNKNDFDKFYLKDGLHLTEKGYKSLTAIIKQIL